MSKSSGSVERVRAALLAAGHPDTILGFPMNTRTAAEAAEAIGCTVAQIAKSIIFRADADGTGAGERAVLVIASGTNRVDPAKVAARLGVTLHRADANWVRQTTGFAVGGVSPIGHLTPPLILIDQDLLALHPIWAAAGAPTHVFETQADRLAGLTGGDIADVRLEEAQAA